MKLPVIFLGHGSPINIISDNKWTQNWRALGRNLGGIEGIVVLSAHWLTRGSFITENEEPDTIYDMFGFPEEVYEKNFPAKNSLLLKTKVKRCLGDLGEFDSNWGYDHGSYTVLLHMYPLINIPVLQVSINMAENAPYHYEIGKRLKHLREENILILGSGNIVHNLEKARPGNEYLWAKNIDHKIVNLVRQREIEEILDLENKKEFRQAAPSLDHFYPFISVLGASDEKDDIKVINRDIAFGSISMTSYLFGFDNYIFGKK